MGSLLRAAVIVCLLLFVWRYDREPAAEGNEVLLTDDWVCRRLGRGEGIGIDRCVRDCRWRLCVAEGELGASALMVEATVGVPSACLRGHSTRHGPQTVGY